MPETVNRRYPGEVEHAKCDCCGLPPGRCLQFPEGVSTVRYECLGLDPDEPWGAKKTLAGAAKEIRERMIEGLGFCGVSRDDLDVLAVNIRKETWLVFFEKLIEILRRQQQSKTAALLELLGCEKDQSQALAKEWFNICQHKRLTARRKFRTQVRGIIQQSIGAEPKFQDPLFLD